MARTSVEENLNISPETVYSPAWQDDNKQLNIQFESPLNYGVGYTVSIYKNAVDSQGNELSEDIILYREPQSLTLSVASSDVNQVNVQIHQAPNYGK